MYISLQKVSIFCHLCRFGRKTWISVGATSDRNDNIVSYYVATVESGIKSCRYGQIWNYVELMTLLSLQPLTARGESYHYGRIWN